MAPARPTILFVAQFEPHPAPLFGAQLRIDAILRALGDEFRVIFACTSRRSEEELLREWPLAAHLAGVITAPRDTDDPADDPAWGSARALATALVPHTVPALHRYRWSTQLVARLRHVLQRESIAAVWASRVASAEMARAAGATHIVVDVDDFEGRMLQERVQRSARYKRRAFHRLQARTMRTYERQLPARFSGVAVCKAADLDLLGAGGEARRWVVANGTSLPATMREAHRSASRDSAPPCLLFVGALGYEPNARAVSWFVHEVLPVVRASRPSARLVVAGRGPVDERWLASLAAHDVDVHVSPPDITPFYRNADVVIAPLMEGGGTSIKVLEALAHETPLVATSAAVRGLAVQDRVHCLIADEAASFASACLEVLRSPDEARRIAHDARVMVAANYSWRAAGETACAAMRAAVSSGSTRSANVVT